MAQTSYTRDQARAYRGMKANAEFDKVESLQAFEAIGLGLGIVKRDGYDDQVRLPKYNQGTLTFDADLVTSNSIVLTVNGDALTAVPFNSDHDTTMDDLVTALEADDDVASATLTDATDNRQITVLAVDGLDMVVSAAVTGGGGQATGTWADGSADSIGYISVVAHDREQARSTGIVQYEQYEPVNCLRRGSVYAYAEEAVNSGDPVYVRIKTNGALVPGNFRNDAASGEAIAFPGAVFKRTVAAAGPVEVEINLP